MESKTLQKEMAKRLDWFTSGNQPWASICAILACRFLSMDKESGIRPMGIGETFHHLWEKSMIKLVGDRAMAVYDNLNL